MAYTMAEGWGRWWAEKLVKMTVVWRVAPTAVMKAAQMESKKGA